MTQVVPKTKDFTIDIDELSQVIGVKTDSIDATYPIKLTNTGIWH